MLDIANKDLWIAAFNRAIRTFIQAFASGLVIGPSLNMTDWKGALVFAATSALASLLMAIVGGLPEVANIAADIGKVIVGHNDAGEQTFTFAIDRGLEQLPLIDGDKVQLVVVTKPTDQELADK